MTVRFRDTDPRPLETVSLACPETGCGWVKVQPVDGIVASLRGHYGYKHPERRLPDRREAREAAGLV